MRLRQADTAEPRPPRRFRKFLLESKLSIGLMAGISGAICGFAGNHYYDEGGVVVGSPIICRPEGFIEDSCALQTLHIFPLSGENRTSAKRALEMIFGKDIAEIPKTLDTVFTVSDWIRENTEYMAHAGLPLKTTIETRRGDCDSLSQALGGMLLVLFGDSTRIQRVLFPVKGRWFPHAYLEFNINAVYGDRTHSELKSELIGAIRRHYGIDEGRAEAVISRGLRIDSNGVWLMIDSTASGIDRLDLGGYRDICASLGTTYQTSAEIPE